MQFMTSEKSGNTLTTANPTNKQKGAKSARKQIIKNYKIMEIKLNSPFFLHS